MKKISVIGTIECEEGCSSMPEAFGFEDAEAYKIKLADIGSKLLREGKKTDTLLTALEKNELTLNDLFILASIGDAVNMCYSLARLRESNPAAFDGITDDEDDE